MILYIKNMVCPRCIQAVENVFKEEDIDVVHIQLGEVVVNDNIPDSKLIEIKSKLYSIGFELLDDSQKKLIEQIKILVIDQIYNKEDDHIVYSDYLSKQLNKDYSYLSKLFSATEGITIEHYIILQKIEKVKELLSYDQLSLSEIAFKLGYSSVAHLSSQFKKVTGLTPSQFKNQSSGLRKSIDNIR